MNPKLKPLIVLFVAFVGILSVPFILVPGCTALVERNREAKIAAYTGDGEIERIGFDFISYGFAIDLDQSDFSKPFDREFKLTNLPKMRQNLQFQIEFHDVNFKKEMLQGARLDINAYNADGEVTGSFTSGSFDSEVTGYEGRHQFFSWDLSDMLTEARDGGGLDSISVRYTPPDPAVYSQEYTIRLECGGTH